jgi:inner membrane protein
LPTILTHPAVPVALTVALGAEKIPGRLLIAGVIASVLPDLDVLAFRLGVAYADGFGHRGFSHSLLFAIVIAIAVTMLIRDQRLIASRIFWFIFVSIASHGLLDAFTNGGLGIAFFWPFIDARYFAPFQPIEVAPLGLSRFLSVRGAAVLWSEMLWVWLPLLSLALVTRSLSPRIRRAQ